jgi:hypothetical protein
MSCLSFHRPISTDASFQLSFTIARLSVQLRGRRSFRTGAPRPLPTPLIAPRSSSPSSAGTRSCSRRHRRSSSRHQREQLCRSSEAGWTAPMICAGSSDVKGTTPSLAVPLPSRASPCLISRPKTSGGSNFSGGQHRSFYSASRPWPRPGRSPGQHGATRGWWGVLVSTLRTRATMVCDGSRGSVLYICIGREVDAKNGLPTASPVGDHKTHEQCHTKVDFEIWGMGWR